MKDPNAVKLGKKRWAGVSDEELKANSIKLHKAKRAKAKAKKLSTVSLATARKKV